MASKERKRKQKYEKMATGVAVLRIFYDILHVFISFEILFQSIWGYK